MEKHKKNTRLERQGATIFILLIVSSIIFISGIASAQTTSLGIFKQGECINLVQSCSNCTTNIITNVLYPNSSIAMGTVTMSTTDSLYYNYTFCNTTALGQYLVNGYGDVDGVNTNWVYDFTVSMNGKGVPSELVIVLFIIAFVIIVAFSIYEIYMMVTHVFLLDYDVIDFAKAGGTYFAILALNLMQRNFLGDPDIAEWFGLFLQIGLWTNIIIPAISLAFTVMLGDWIKLNRLRKANG